MSKLKWTPWHKVVELRDDVRTGSLSMAEFAADLNDVVMQRGHRMVYEDPAQFFALTYPTTNLRDLAKDVVLRLAGKNQRAIRQLELTYGGGKTHTLITLYHLVNEPEKLPDLSAVREFKQHIGIEPPKARVAVLPFDKVDVEKGLEVRGHKGTLRWLKQPWSIVAWQLGEEEGLKILHPDDKAEERETPPAEPLLERLFRLPEQDGLSTLILIDEVLMFARGAVDLNPAWEDRLKNFFQYMTQAVTKVDRCAVVASLLATDPAKSDETGKKLERELSAIFGREKEEGVQPVLKEDVAEVLRRRFFTPESIADREAFRQHVYAIVERIAELDEETKKNKKAVEERFLRSYPFHPDLTEVFYGKWTGLNSFQRTRGVLRTYALGLRDSEKWDQSPLAGPNVFLPPEGEEGISEAARELTGVASKEQIEGQGQNWTAVLEGELQKARACQDEYPGLKFREVEQAVFATFIHSQPIGAKALLNEIVVLVGATRPDKIELEKALRLWFDRSWFLDESADADAKPGEPKRVPSTWRLGSKPNLKQMHADALTRVPEDMVESRLIEDIRKLRSLAAGASAAGAKVHMLPEKPSDVGDDGEFHYAVLGPAAASESGKPSPEARRFIEENTGPNNPRKERNAVVFAVPSRDGLFGVRNAIKQYLGWEIAREDLKDQELDPIREGLLSGYITGANKRIPTTLVQAYCIVVTVSEADDVQAFKIQVGDKPLFQTIKEDKRSRIQDAAISADAILPGGPYDLWREDEDARRVKDLVGAFARFPRLPKMMNRPAILDTIVNGCVEGIFVARLTRPDKSIRTFWRQRPDENVLDDAGLELVLPEKAELTEIAPALLHPGAIKELWMREDITVREVRAFFTGGSAIKIDRGGYEESIAVPKAPAAVVDAALTAGIRDGRLWLTSGPASLLGEDVPAGLLTEEAVLQAPPAPIPPLELLPENLAEAWSDNETTAVAIVAGLSQKAGKNLPWKVVCEAVDGGFRARMIERTPESGAWPCEFPAAGGVRIRLASGTPPRPEPPKPQPPRPGTRVGQATLKPNEIQDLADVMGDLLKARAGYDLAFDLRIELATEDEKVVEEVNRVLGGVNDDMRVK